MSDLHPAHLDKTHQDSWHIFGIISKVGGKVNGPCAQNGQLMGVSGRKVSSSFQPQPSRQWEYRSANVICTRKLTWNGHIAHQLLIWNLSLLFRWLSQCSYAMNVILPLQYVKKATINRIINSYLEILNKEEILRLKDNLQPHWFYPRRICESIVF